MSKVKNCWIYYKILRDQMCTPQRESVNGNVYLSSHQLNYVYVYVCVYICIHEGVPVPMGATPL